MAIGLYHTEAVLTIYLAQALVVLYAISYHGSNDWFLLFTYILVACIVSVTFHFFAKTGFRINRDRFIRQGPYQLLL